MNYYISDLHFGHKKCIEFDSRPFSSVEEMDAAIIQNWNSKVSDEDDVYILGDFCYRNAYDPTWYLKQLKGKKHLIVGNHDRNLWKNQRACAMFESIDQILMIKDGNQNVVLCHYPLAEWDMERYGTIHIYGHIHVDTGPTFEYMQNKNAYNAGCMINGYYPVQVSELIENNRTYINKVKELPTKNEAVE